MAFHLQVLLLLGTASLLQAACPFVPVLSDFDPARFEGKWYQVEWLNTGWASVLFDQSTRCLEMTFDGTGNGSFAAFSTWDFEFGQYFIPTFMNSDYNRISNSFPSYFQTNRVPWIPLPKTTIYVLDTDYKKYAILYSCTDVGFGLDPAEMSWIIHRKRIGLTNRRRKNILAALTTDLGMTFIDASRYSRIDNTNCGSDGGGSGNSTTTQQPV